MKEIKRANGGVTPRDERRRQRRLKKAAEEAAAVGPEMKRGTIIKIREGAFDVRFDDPDTQVSD